MAERGRGGLTLAIAEIVCFVSTISCRQVIISINFRPPLRTISTSCLASSTAARSSSADLFSMDVM